MARRDSFIRLYKMPKEYRDDWENLAEEIRSSVEPDRSAYYYYGYEVIGPIILGFSSWLQQKALTLGLDKLFFVARDGELLQEAYKLVNGEKAIDNSYMYASRAAVRLPYLSCNSSIESFVSLFKGAAFSNVNYIEMSHMMGLDSSTVYKYWNASGIGNDERITIYDYMNSDSKFNKFYNKIKSVLANNAHDSRKNFFEYLREIEFTGNIGLIDIGWYGSLQKCIDSLICDEKIDAHLFGLYLGLREEIERKSNVQSYIPRGEAPAEYVSNFVEYPFMTFEGSTLGYERIGDRVIPIFAEYEYKDSEMAINTIQDMRLGALNFVSVFNEKNFAMNPASTYQALKIISKHPTFREAKLFGDLPYQETVLRKLAKPKNMLNYVRHPKNFKEDFSKCSWKPGFLKRLCIIPFPYYELISEYNRANRR